MYELDDEPTEHELSEAINGLTSGKAPGNDNIPAEAIKENKDVLLPHLHKLLIQCWREGKVPYEMRDSSIVTLYKNKGDKGDCNNYRGISLLSVTGKAFARVILKRLQRLAERILPESQCGFRAGRSTTDMIFTLRQLQEKCREQDKPLHIAFIDLTKAFDTVSRPALYQVLEGIGCPPTLLKLIISFHQDMKATVKFDGSTSESFGIKNGVKQGCVLAPTLFGIFFAVLLKHAFNETAGDIFIRTRFDGQFFNLARLRSKTKTTEVLISELLFADDAAIVAHSGETLQSLINNLDRACDVFSLSINVNKTVVLSQGPSSTTNISLKNCPLRTVESFNYLGSTITSMLSLEEEINIRLGKASTTFGRLTKRVWKNKKLTLRTKILIYQACVLSTLLYGAETWTIYARQEKKLQGFHMRSLRRIMNIKWQEKITNTEILKKAKIPSLLATLIKRRLRWLGHIRRMTNNRIPKQVLFGELSDGKRARGRPKLRFKDLCKASMTDFKIKPDLWVEMASDRDMWRSAMRKGEAEFEKALITKMEDKRQRRKMPALQRPDHPCSYCDRPCHSAIGRVSHERACLAQLDKMNSTNP